MEFEVLDTIAKLDEAAHYFEKELDIYFDTETTGLKWWKSRVFLISVSNGIRTVLIDCDRMPKEDVALFLNRIFQGCDSKGNIRRVFGHNIKFDRHQIKHTFDVDMRCEVHDTLIMAFLLNESRSNKLKSLLKEVCGITEDYEPAVVEWLEAQYEKKDQYDYSAVPRDLMYPYAAMDTWGGWQLKMALEPQIKEHLSRPYEIDRKVEGILYKMEHRGILIDRDYLKTLLDSEKTLTLNAQFEVYRVVGKEFNLESSPQLAQILYSDLALTCTSFTEKGEMSTNDIALSGLDHPVVEAIRKYREHANIVNYIESLFEYCDDDGWVHPSYSTTVTRTGRFSCRQPNLQNPPKYPPLRKGFPCAPGTDMYLLDQSQIEMVFFAYYSRDPKMLEAIRNGVGLHETTAAEVFEKSVSEVLDHERQMGKGTNFSIIFCVGKKKLASYINGYISDISKKLTDAGAQNFKLKYFEKFPMVQAFQQKVMGTVERFRAPWGHYVMNKFGRVCRIPPDKSYRGVNYLIQGTAAYYMKSCMIAADEKYPDLLWAQNIHDAIRFDIPHCKNMRELLADLVALFTNPMDFGLPIKCTIEYSSTTWDDVKKVKLEDIPNARECLESKVGTAI